MRISYTKNDDGYWVTFPAGGMLVSAPSSTIHLAQVFGWTESMGTPESFLDDRAGTEVDNEDAEAFYAEWY